MSKVIEFLVILMTGTLIAFAFDYALWGMVDKMDSDSRRYAQEVNWQQK